MASLQELKSRINSVSTTKKITKAMELVATAKLQKARKNLNGIKEYYSSVYDMFHDLVDNVQDVSRLYPDKPADTDVYIMVTSDIGLCGAYNANIFKIAKALMRPNDYLVVIGNLGISWATSQEYPVISKFSHVGDEPEYNIAAAVAMEALPMFLEGKVRRVNLLYTKFVNTVTTQADMLQLLPIVRTTNKKETVFAGLTEFEPSPEDVLRNALPLYIAALIFGAQTESKVSEMASRRNAMETASDNADDLISNLFLEYNRLRQAKITQEIAEIVGGSETV